MFGIWPRSHPLRYQIFAIKRIWLLIFNSSKNALSNVGREQNWPEGIELGSKISESIPRWQVIWEKKTKASYSKVFNVWNKRHTPSTLLAVRLPIWKAGEELGWFVLPGVSTVAQAVFGECSRWSWWSVCFWVELRSWVPGTFHPHRCNIPGAQSAVRTELYARPCRGSTVPNFVGSTDFKHIFYFVTLIIVLATFIVSSNKASIRVKAFSFLKHKLSHRCRVPHFCVPAGLVGWFSQARWQRWAIGAGLCSDRGRWGLEQQDVNSLTIPSSFLSFWSLQSVGLCCE